MEITMLKEEDILPCLNIYNYYIKNTCFTLEEEVLDYLSFKNRCLKIKEKYPYIVIKENNKVLGYAYLNTFNERSAYRYTADLSIYIDKEHLHEHLGNLLLSSIEKFAKEYNITTLISIVTSENTNSSNFHLKNGFILEGTLHNVAKKFNKELSISYYRKPL